MKPQKPRSPYTGGGGGFNLQQLKAMAFKEPATLNEMPFLAQFTFSDPPTSCADRGQRSGPPRSNSYNYNNTKMDSSPIVQGMLPMRHLHTEKPVLQQSSKYSNTNNYYKNKYSNKNNNHNNKNRGNYESDTDSETEYRKHLYSSDSCIFPKDSRLRRGIEYWKSTMPPERQRRMEAAMDRFCENTFLNRMILLLQLFGILAMGAMVQGTRLGVNVTHLSFGLLHCKLKLRIFMRMLLWSLGGAKGHDALLFLVVLVISPWLFLISLFGFIISFVVNLKEALHTMLINYVFK